MKTICRGLLHWSCACIYKSAEEQSFVKWTPHHYLMTLDRLPYVRKCHVPDTRSLLSAICILPVDNVLRVSISTAAVVTRQPH